LGSGSQEPLPPENRRQEQQNDPEDDVRQIGRSAAAATRFRRIPYPSNGETLPLPFGGIIENLQRNDGVHPDIEKI